MAVVITTLVSGRQAVMHPLMAPMGGGRVPSSSERVASVAATEDRSSSFASLLPDRSSRAGSARPARPSFARATADGKGSLVDTRA